MVKQEAALSFGTKSPWHRTPFSLCCPVVCGPILMLMCSFKDIAWLSMNRMNGLQDVHKPKDEKKLVIVIHIALLGGIEAVVHKIHFLWGFWG